MDRLSGKVAAVTRRGVRHRRGHGATVRGGGGQGRVCRPRRRSGQARRGGDRGERRPGALRGSAHGARGRGRGLRPASRGSLRPARRPRQQRRDPAVSHGGRGQRRELGRDPRREPQGVRVLREGGDPAHPSGRRREHRQRRVGPVRDERGQDDAVRHHQGRGGRADAGHGGGSRARPDPGERRVSGAHLHALSRAPHPRAGPDPRAVPRGRRQGHHAEATGHARGSRRVHPVPRVRRRVVS